MANSLTSLGTQALIESCANCRFHRRGDNSYRCHRRAPAAYTFLKFYELELIRDIAWSLRTLARTEQPDKLDDVATEATEAMSSATWPDVDPEDWCGEWEAIRE